MKWVCEIFVRDKVCDTPFRKVSVIALLETGSVTHLLEMGSVRNGVCDTPLGNGVCDIPVRQGSVTPC